MQTDTTDKTLFVQTSSEEIQAYDITRIIDSIVMETGLERGIAASIAQEVEKRIKTAELKRVTAPLIREMVVSRMLELGYEREADYYSRIGIPNYDYHMMLRDPNKENSNQNFNPESINLTVAGIASKQYALSRVFDRQVAKAHMNGDIHLHDLDFIMRPYCSGNPIEYLKKFGLSLDTRGNINISKPAKHPEVLVLHLTKMASMLQSHFAGAIGFDAVNTFMAPYLEGLSYEKIKQIAQMLIFEFAQQAVARGAQITFSDLNLFFDVPKHFRDVPAIGPGGKFTGNTYEDYTEEARALVKAMFEVYLEGDAHGRPFFFPKPDLHIRDEDLKKPEFDEFINLASEVAAVKGNTYWIFDRGDEMKISECCRLQFKLNESDLQDIKEPWRMRYVGLQNVSINLPRTGIEANGDDAKLFDLIDERMELVARAHQQKRALIQTLLNMGNAGPLAFLAMKFDGQPYLRLWRASHLVGIVGLNELVQVHTGEEMHESNSAFKFGLKIIAHMYKKTKEMTERDGLHYTLEQTPAESTAYRFARLDVAKFDGKASEIVKGDVKTGGVYYTNSTYFNVSAPIPSFKKTYMEGLFHPMIESGALTHVWLGESKPPAESITNFVKKTHTKTQNQQICFDPEFTICLDCGRVSRGLHPVCPYCHSTEIRGVYKKDIPFLPDNVNKRLLLEMQDKFKNQKLF